MKLDWRLLRLLVSHRSAFLLSLTAGFVAGSLVTFQANYLSRVVSLVFIENTPLSETRIYLAVLFIIILLRGALTFVHEVISRQVTAEIKRDLRLRLFTRLNARGPAFLKTGEKEGIRTGELVNIVFQGVENLDVYFSQYVPQVVLSILVPASILFFVWYVDFLSGLILFLTAPLMPFFIVLIGDRAETLTRRQWWLLSSMSAHFLDVLQGLATLKIFGRSKAQADIIQRVGDTYRQTTMGVLKVAFLSSLTLEWLATLSTAIIAVEIGLRLLYGYLAFEQAFLVLLLTPEFYNPLRSLAARFHAGMAGAASADQIFEILDAPGIEGGKLPGHVPAPLHSQTEMGEHQDGSNSKRPLPPFSISFEHVSFSHPGRDGGLENISFELPAGQLLVVVGESGAGKSSLVDLLLRFQEPMEGRIKINGLPLSELPREEWLESVAWVPQRPYILNTTVLENIRLGRPEARISDVVNAARMAQAHDFIRHLPQGYETIVGEHGARLSGGEAQRIALARAFLKKASLFILDEANAHLDPLTATRIHQSILERKERQTILMITHNMNLLQGADWMLVLKNGRQIRFEKYLEPDQKFYWLNGADRSAFSPPRLNATPILSANQSTDIKAIRIEAAMASNQRYPLSKSGNFTFLLELIAPFFHRLISTIFLGWATIASGIGLLATSAYLISAAALHPSIAVLQVPIVAVRAFGLLRGIFRYLERYVSHDTTFRILTRLRVLFYRSLEPRIPGQLLAFSSGDLLARIHNDISALQDFFIRALSPPFVWILILMTTSIILGSHIPGLVIIAIVSHLFIGFFLPITVRMLDRNERRHLPYYRGILSSRLIDGIQGMPDIHAFGANAKQKEKIVEACGSLARLERHLGLTRSVESAMALTFSNLVVWGVLLKAIPYITNGRLSGVNLASLLLTVAASFESTLLLNGAIETLEDSSAVAARLNEIVKAPAQIESSPKPLPIPSQITLEIRDLRFSYPEIPQNPNYPQVERKPETRGEDASFIEIESFTLNAIDFSLPPGKRLALVGPTGAGKSTIFKLLLRFWEFNQGEILFGGRDIRQLEADAVRANFSLVPQQVHLFNTTIMENLRIAKPNANFEEITQATKLAQIHEFITTLPQGYETWIGEHGLRLSAGERQRLAIARTLLSDAPILLLDEPVSHLDPDLARSVLHNIYTHYPERSIIIITHRLLEMEAMDEILFMLGGKIIARGQHSELLHQEPLYRLMWQWENNSDGIVGRNILSS